MTPEDYLNRLYELSGKKIKRMEEILKLTNLQQQSIDVELIDSLQELVNQKQMHIDEINRIDNDFEVYMGGLKKSLKVNSLDDPKLGQIKGARDLKQAVTKIMILIQEISKSEKVNSQGTKKMLSDIGDEIKKLNDGKKVNSAYQSISRVQSPSFYIDKKK